MSLTELPESDFKDEKAKECSEQRTRKGGVDGDLRLDGCFTVCCGISGLTVESFSTYCG